ncbi:MAG: RNase adapter RapZ [Steroidobacteraceae bacterium]|nr:RNase adapter RapZ [Steroidobacteraceae bacterium]MCW5573607.1 RNase adapter RapZ [Steroidobacteraceae bacterium]
MRIVVVSGISGSGKSVALHMLEDLGYYCIDNIPAALLTPLVAHTVRSAETAYERIAVGLDARNTAAEIATVPKLVQELKKSGIQCEVLFLTANDDELLRRFAATRRKHPMSQGNVGLREAIAIERDLLEPVMYAADRVIDTSRMGVHALRDVVQKSAEERATPRLSITFESFGFKHGIPGDADFVFDARSLPNPYWEPQLRPLTGRDPEVIRFLESEPAVARLVDDITTFIEARIPEHTAANRRYLTVAIGCTGGQHRSVYIANRLVERFAAHHPHVSARHNELRARIAPP